MEDKKSQPPLRHGSHRSTDAKPEARHLASSLGIKPADVKHANQRAADKRLQFRIESHHDAPRNPSSAPTNIESMSILKASPVTSPPPRSGATAKTLPNMHTILEFRADRPRMTTSAKATDKSNNNNNIDNGALVNGFGKSSTTGKVVSGPTLRFGTSYTDNGQSVSSITNEIGISLAINETINGNHQNPGLSSKKDPLHGSLKDTAVVQKKTIAEPFSKDSRLDQVATNNRRNSWKESRFEANIVLAQCIEKTHLGSQHQKSAQKSTSVQKPAESSRSQSKSIGDQQLVGPSEAEVVRTNGNAHVGKKNLVSSDHINGRYVGSQNQKSTESSRNQSKSIEIQQQVMSPEAEVTRANGNAFVSNKNPVSSSYMNGQHGQSHDVTAISLAELCRRNNYGTVDSVLKQNHNGLTIGRQWSLRSDISGQMSSDSEEENMGFFLQENGSPEDPLDDGSSSVASFAGRRNYLMPEKVICGVTGTVRGMRNRVRAGIATFVHPANATKNFSQLENSKVVVYTTSNGIVRETFQKCLKVKTILSTFLVPFEERDIFKSRAYQRELVDRLSTDHMAIPQVFVEGHHLGDANIIEDLNEQGKLRKILRPYKRPGAHIPCQKCGGYKLLLCNACNGSKKSVRRNCFTESLGPLRCGKCDECGLIQCDLCCTVQRDDSTINAYS